MCRCQVTFGFWSWSKKDFCRVDMEMDGGQTLRLQCAVERVHASRAANRIGLRHEFATKVT